MASKTFTAVVVFEVVDHVQADLGINGTAFSPAAESKLAEAVADAFGSARVAYVDQGGTL